MRTHHSCSLLVLAAVATTSCSRAAVPSPPETSNALRTAVEAKRPAFAAEDGDRGHHVWQEEQRFYGQNGYQLAWSDGKRPRGQMEDLIRAIRAADQDGLEPADYHLDELDASRRAPLTPE